MSAHCLSTQNFSYSASLTTHGKLANLDEAPPRWHVVWTREGCERLVYEQLRSKGIEGFLPEIDRWRRRGGLGCVTRMPLFPGYVFLHHAIDRWTHLEIAKARGAVKLLADDAGRPAPVPEREIDAVRQVHKADVPRMTHPYLDRGRRVRVVRGPLMNVEGILAEERRGRGLLVLSIELLRQSVAVQVDSGAVVPA